MRQIQYEIQFKASAWRALQRIEERTRSRLKEAIWALSDDPRPQGCKKLKVQAKYYRIRLGDYRVAYEIKDDVLVVLVLKVGRRGGFYRRI